VQHVRPNLGIAESTARLRATLQLRLAGAARAAAAPAINASALVTHDRDFSRVRSLRVICQLRGADHAPCNPLEDARNQWVT